LKKPIEHHQSYLVRVAFDGTNYVGWQRQPKGRAVQKVLEEAFEKITHFPVKLRAAGRTDAGVHALNFPADFAVPLELDYPRLRRAWDSVTPRDIIVLDVHRAPNGFSARRQAVLRTYRYMVFCRPHPSPFLSRYSWHTLDVLDIKAMREAARALVGEHDFTTFRAASSEAKHSVRRIDAATVRELTTAELQPLAWWPYAGAPEAGLICFTIAGTAFLKHQVRSIVGTLVAVLAPGRLVSHISPTADGSFRLTLPIRSRARSNCKIKFAAGMKFVLRTGSRFTKSTIRLG